MTGQALNPYLPSWEYVPDGEPRIFEGRLYVFGSHDRFGGSKFCENDYVGWSAPLSDLSDWTCHGVLYRSTDDPENRDRNLQLFAPDVARGPDGRYYLYYCMNFRPSMSVAVSDKPEGPYEFLSNITRANGVALGRAEPDVLPFDPGILVDDDGRVFVYFGFASPDPGFQRGMTNAGLRADGGYVVELGADMYTMQGEPRRIVPMAGHSDGSGFEGHEFFEASSPRRIGDEYFLVYSSTAQHELCYATSSRPDAGFRFRGTLVSNGDIGYGGRGSDDAVNFTGNNHGGLVDIDGHWYVFYHRHTNRRQVNRQGCAERLERSEDGTFTQVEMTSCGLNHGPLRGEGTYPAYIACVLRGKDGAGPTPFQQSGTGPVTSEPYLTQTGGDREGHSDQYIANMHSGSVAGFKYFDLTDTQAVEISVSGHGSGTMTLSTELDGPAIAEMRVPNRSCGPARLTLPPGQNRTGMYFRFEGFGSLNFHSFTLHTRGQHG
jgi:arabinoxylan arabinofuranohydrolase